MNLPDIEVVSAQVHEAWMQSKRSQGVESRKAEDGEELMALYSVLSEKAKELDRGTVRAVFNAIEASLPVEPVQVQEICAGCKTPRACQYNGCSALPVEPPILERESFWLTLREDLHPLTVNLVVRFARAMAKKLADAEKKYGYSDGWRSPNWIDECRAKLLEHVAKGDPRDVAAYCAFLWHHGEKTALPVDEKVQKSYWLIECKNNFSGWWTGRTPLDCRLFDSDSNNAFRFVSKEDAEEQIELRGNSCMKSTEHIWIDAALAVPVEPVQTPTARPFGWFFEGKDLYQFSKADWCVKPVLELHQKMADESNGKYKLTALYDHAAPAAKVDEKVQDDAHVVLTEKQWDHFVETMQNPQPPTEALLAGIALLEKYRAQAAAPTAKVELPVVAWIPVSERLPELPKNSEREFIITCKRAHNGKSYVFAASYLESLMLQVEDSDNCPEEGLPFSGWHKLMTSDGDFDTCWQPVETQGDIVTAWQSLPIAFDAQAAIAAQGKP